MVFGIIVDTFSELREEKNSTQEKMEGECFICGLKAVSFDRFGKGWNHHIKKEHHMWDYLYLLRHFDEKDATEFTFLEQHIAEKIYRNNNDFYPFGRALVMPPGVLGGSDPQAKLSAGITEQAAADGPTLEKLTAMIAALHAKLEATENKTEAPKASDAN